LCLFTLTLLVHSPPLAGGGRGGGTFPLTSILSHGGERKIKDKGCYRPSLNFASSVYTGPVGFRSLRKRIISLAVKEPAAKSL